MIVAKVNGQSLRLQFDTVVADSVRFPEIRFSFGEEWNGYRKTVLFGADGLDVPIAVALDVPGTLSLGDDGCFVPYEVLRAPGFTVSVFGTSAESRITTEAVFVAVRESGYGDGSAPGEPTPNVYEQLLQGFSRKMDRFGDVTEQDGTLCVKAAQADFRLDLSGGHLVNLALPTGDADAVNKAYVDRLIGDAIAALDALVRL